MVDLRGVKYDQFVVPGCHECEKLGVQNSIVKPNVVFFGETISDAVRDRSLVRFRLCVGGWGWVETLIEYSWDVQVQNGIRKFEVVGIRKFAGYLQRISVRFGKGSNEMSALLNGCNPSSQSNQASSGNIQTCTHDITWTIKS
jgi:hypothetical protein